MSLGAAQIDRYSRQIILPEVGGRGQERLLGARVLLAGHDDAAVATATLLGRAGVGTLHLVAGPASLPELSPDCRVERIADGVPVPDADVFVDLRCGSTAALGREAARHRRPLVLAVAHGAGGAVATLVGQPCGACVPPDALGVGGRESATAGVAPAVVLAVGAVAAAEVLAVLLGARRAGRVQRVDVGGGSAVALVGSGCALCKADT